MGWASWGKLSSEGTKVRANASKRSDGISHRLYQFDHYSENALMPKPTIDT